jgi:serine/threonine protein kinase
MPPEQWRSEELTPAADQYAMAVTIYQLMTGRLPFESTTPYGMLHKHLHEEPTPPQTYRDDLPYKVQETLSRALEKDPANRWESMTAFSVAFDALRGRQDSLPASLRGRSWCVKTALGLSGPISISISPDSPWSQAGSPI